MLNFNELLTFNKSNEKTKLFCDELRQFIGRHFHVRTYVKDKIDFFEGVHVDELLLHVLYNKHFLWNCQMFAQLIYLNDNNKNH